jgi:type VI secretion system protein ImpA
MYSTQPSSSIMPAGAMHLDVETLLRRRAANSENRDVRSLELRQELEKARRNPGSHDGSRGSKQVPRSAWEEIVSKTAGSLADGGRDLGLAARLTEAITKLHGFAGLRDGLHLMRRLVEDCWDELTPRPRGDGDLDPLLAPLRWIDDPDRGALFPHTVRAIQFARHAERSYSWIDWKRLKDRGDSSTWSAFERAIYVTPRIELEESLEELTQSHCELERLTGSLSTHTPEPFEMPGLWRAIDDCRALLEHVLQQVPAAATDDQNHPEILDVENAASWSGDGTEVGFTQTQVRAQIYAQIEQLAMTLQRIEPHSPVPHLLLRAVQLGALPFPQLMSELLRDQNVLGRMNQELGIRPET